MSVTFALIAKVPLFLVARRLLYQNDGKTSDNFYSSLNIRTLVFLRRESDNTPGVQTPHRRGGGATGAGSNCSLGSVCHFSAHEQERQELQVSVCLFFCLSIVFNYFFGLYCSLEPV